MANIIDEILKQIPNSDENISDSVFEGANIVLYTKNKDFYLNSNGTIKKIVNDIKKRIELRPDPSISMDQEKAKAIIEKIIPKEAGIANIIFDSQRSIVIIEAEKLGLAIGKQGEILKEIKRQTLWVPTISRTPMIKSKIIENVRYVLYENDEFRRKFLNRVGKRIYDGWKRDRKNEWIRISFLGAGRQVGRSCFLLQTPESRILLDCGIDPAGQDAAMFPHFDAPEFNLNDIDAVIISHPHLDHSGILPYLFKMGYDGPVYMTAPARDIIALLALDMINISQKEGKDPLYGSTDVKTMVKHTICLNYEEVTDITPDIRVTLYNAGHTLGSALVHMHIGNGLHNFLYSGDLLYEDTNLLQHASTMFPRLETVMMEATYGGKTNVGPGRQEAEDELISIINKTVERGGKVLMPVLGVGRSQEVMLIIEKAIREGRMPKLPVYVQGMVWEITAIHTTYPDYFNPKIRKSIFHKDHNPFLSDVFKYVGSQKEQQQVIDSGDSCVIIATSGMMEGGAIIEYFKQLAENKKHSLIFSCYQAPNTLGNRLLYGDKEINFGNQERPDIVKVNLELYSMTGFSGHSNRNQLMNWIKHLDPPPKKIIVVHGEASRVIDLASSIHKNFKVETIAPRNLETIRLR